MPTEDFTTYTEVNDPQNHLSQTATRATFTGLRRNDVAYLYKDKGVDHFDGNYEHLLDVRGTAFPMPSAIAIVWGIANVLDTSPDCPDEHFVWLWRYSSGDIKLITLSERIGGTTYSDSWGGVEVDKTYFLKIKRDESVGTYGTLYCGIYSTAELRNAGDATDGDIDNLLLTLHEKANFRYIYGTQSDYAGTLPLLSGWCENLDLQEEPPPTVISSAATDINYTTATLNGNITDTEGGNATKRGFDWGLSSGAPYANSWIESGSYGAGAFGHGIADLPQGTTIYFRAKAYKPSGSWGYGSELFFVTETPSYGPSGINFITPVEVTPGSAGSWQEVNLSAHIPSGSTGAVLWFKNNTLLFREYGARKYGSTDNRHGDMDAYAHLYAMIGVDSNRVCEVWVEHITEVDVFIVGYFDDNCGFFTNGIDKSLGSAGSWIGIDVSSDGVPSGATGVIFEVVNTDTTNWDFGFRKNGSTDSFVDELYRLYHIPAIIGLDLDRICEGQVESTTVHFYLLGYTKAPVIFKTNADDISLGVTGSWEKIDITSQTSPNANGCIVQMRNSSAVAAEGGIRRYGETDERKKDIVSFAHIWALSGIDYGQVLEGYIENTNVDFMLIGYTTEEGEAVSISPSPVTALAAIQAPTVGGSGSTPITPSSIAAPSTVQPPSISGSGVASISPAAIAAPSIVQSPSLAATGAASISPTSVSVPSAVQAPVLSGSGVASISLSPVVAPSAVQSPSVSGSGAASISPSSVAAPSAVQAPTLAATGAAPVSPSPVAAPSSVQSPSISGSGAASIAPPPVQTTSSVVAPSVAVGAQVITLPSVAASSAVQTPTLAATGSAPISPSPVSAPSSVQAPAVSGSASASISPSPVAAPSAVQAPTVDATGAAPVSPASIPASSAVQVPSISGTGVASVSPNAVAAPSAIQAPSIAGSGVASVAPSSVQVASSVVAPTVTTGAQIVALSPVAASSSIQAPSVAGSGVAPVSPSAVAATSAVQGPSVAGSGVAPISPNAIATPSAIQAPSISGSGIAPISPSSIQAASSVVAPTVAAGAQIVALPPVAASSSIQAPSVAGSGVAPVSPSAVAAPSVVQAPAVAGSGVAPITLTPVGSQATVVAPTLVSILTITLTPVMVSSSIMAPIVRELHTSPSEFGALEARVITLEEQPEIEPLSAKVGAHFVI